MDGITTLLTDDGSHSLRSERFGVTYHSTHGAIQESRHIFIEAGLIPLLANAPKMLTVLEMGLGTGLNALLVRLLARHHPGTHFHYLTFERYPIDLAMARGLNYPALLETTPSDLLALHEANWNESCSLGPNFTFTKRAVDFLSIGPSAGEDPADIIFYDAFAPVNQPELWTEEAMRHAARWLGPGGRLVTYCAKGQFKRNLQAAGFTVEALPGPIGKREITRAVLYGSA